MRVLGSDGSLLHETRLLSRREPKVTLYRMPESRPLVHVSWIGACGRNHDENLFLWYSAAAKQIVAQSDSLICGNYKHLGDGLFEGTAYMDGSSYVFRYRWVNGELVKTEP